MEEFDLRVENLSRPDCWSIFSFFMIHSYEHLLWLCSEKSENLTQKEWFHKECSPRLKQFQHSWHNQRSKAKRRCRCVKRSETLKLCFLFISAELQSGAAAQIGPRRGDENQICQRKEKMWRDDGEEERGRRRWGGRTDSQRALFQCCCRAAQWSLLTRVLPRAAATVSVGGLSRRFPSRIHFRAREKPPATRTRGPWTILTASSSFIRPSAAAQPVIPVFFSSAISHPRRKRRLSEPHKNGRGWDSGRKMFSPIQSATPTNDEVPYVWCLEVGFYF